MACGKSLDTHVTGPEGKELWAVHALASATQRLSSPELRALARLVEAGKEGLELLNNLSSSRAASVQLECAAARMTLAHVREAHRAAEAKLAAHGGEVQRLQDAMEALKTEHAAEAKEMEALLGQLQQQWVAKKQQYARELRRRSAPVPEGSLLKRERRYQACRFALCPSLPSLLLKR